MFPFHLFRLPQQRAVHHHFAGAGARQPHQGLLQGRRARRLHRTLHGHARERHAPHVQVHVHYLIPSTGVIFVSL